jgi:hypothetical protein
MEHTQKVYRMYGWGWVDIRCVDNNGVCVSQYQKACLSQCMTLNMYSFL